MARSTISLRPIKLSDVDDFLKWAGDERVTRYLRWDTIKSKEEALDFIENFAIPHPWYRVICDPEEDRAVGVVAVKPGPGEDRCRAHVTYAVAPDQWGRGVATKAMKAAVKMACKDFTDLTRIETLVEVENVASQKALEKIGFLKEGLLRKYCYFKGEVRDLLIYSILSTDEI